MKNLKKIIIFLIFILIVLIGTSQIFADLGAKPDKEKEITVVLNDFLSKLSFKYYTEDDRKRGAHWIHIYEYSIDKKYINPKLQPILPYGKNDAFVKLYVGQKVAIPFFNGLYPSANSLLKKYNLKLSEDGKSVEAIDTGLPINMEMDTDSEGD